MAVRARSDQIKIAHSKDMHNALITLYEASTYLHPTNSGQFDYEDSLIRNARGNEKASGRIRGLQSTVAEHEKNIEALKKELGALKP